jgi:hypothetical protein
MIHLAQDVSLANLCKQGNETSGSVRRREFLDQMSDHQLLQEGLCPKEDSDNIIVICRSLKITTNSEQQQTMIDNSVTDRGITT